MTKPVAPEKNQCDGCALGLPVDENGNHLREGAVFGIHQSCTKHKYGEPAPEPSSKAEPPPYHEFEPDSKEPLHCAVCWQYKPFYLHKSSSKLTAPALPESEPTKCHEYVRTPTSPGNPVKAVLWDGTNLDEVRKVYPGLGEEYMRDKGCRVGDYVVSEREGMVRFYSATVFHANWIAPAATAERELPYIYAIKDWGDDHCGFCLASDVQEQIAALQGRIEEVILLLDNYRDFGNNHAWEHPQILRDKIRKILTAPIAPEKGQD